MKYIIMCGGQYSNWEQPRQLTRIRGEPVVARTIRLLQEHGVEDIAISSCDDRFLVFGVPVIKHINDYCTGANDYAGSWADAFYPTKEPACYLMGDVVFSVEAIRTIVETDTDGIQFFASAPPFAPEYIKPYAEPFAFKVADQERFQAAVDFVRKNERSGIFNRPPIAWELWQVIKGTPINEIDFGNYVAINDYTCDIDDMEDAMRIKEVVQ